MVGEDLSTGNKLGERMNKDGKIDVAEESEEDIKALGYVSELYIENNTKRDLLEFFNGQFKCKQFTDDQREIGKLPWKRIFG